MKFKYVVLMITVAILPGLLKGADGRNIALMLKTRGKVEIKKLRARSWTAALRGQRINSGEIVRTGDKAFAALIFTDDRSLLKVRANSSVQIQGKREKNSIAKTIGLNLGELWAKVTKQNSSMRIDTPSGVATVKGTELSALFENDNFIVYCYEGIVELFNQFGRMLLRAKQMARMTRNSPPQQIEGNPEDIFRLSGGSEGQKLEIEFEDEQGNKKKLIIEF